MTSLVATIMMVLSIGMTAVSAGSIDASSEPILSPADVPDVIPLQEARDNGFVERLEEEETEYSVVFRNTEGTRTAYYFTVPVKYRDAEGQLHDKTNRLSSAGRTQYAFAGKTNDFQTYFPSTLSEQTPLMAEYRGHQIAMYPTSFQGTEPMEYGGTVSTGTMITETFEADASKITASSESTGNLEDSVVYMGVFGQNTGLRYTPMYNGVKEDILLTENIGKNTFVFCLDLDGLLPQRRGDGYVLLQSETEEPVAVINPIVVMDSNGKISFEGHTMDMLLLYGTTYQLTVTVDSDFLNDPDTVYPVCVDPSITTPSSVVSDTTIYGTPNDTDHVGDIFTLAGNSSLYTEMSTYAGRTIVSFYYMLCNYNYSFQNATINKAEYFVRDISGGVGDGTLVRVHMMTKGTPSTLVGLDSGTYWNEYASSVITSKTIGTSGTGRNGSGSGDWYGFNVSSAFTSWKNGNYGGYANHYGLMLKASNETSTGVVFASADYGNAAYTPFVRLTYSISSMETPGINTNTIYQLKNTTSGKNMIFSSLGQRAPAKQGSYTPGSNYANLKFSYRGNGEYTIHSADNFSQVLSVGDSEGDTFNSRPVGLYQDYGSSVQRWYIVLGDSSGGGGGISNTAKYYFVSKAYPNLILSTNGATASGSQLYVSENGNGIYWTFFHREASLFTQRSYYTCGPACCVMMLQAFGVNLDTLLASYNAPGETNSPLDIKLFIAWGGQVTTGTSGYGRIGDVLLGGTYQTLLNTYLEGTTSSSNPFPYRYYSGQVITKQDFVQKVKNSLGAGFPVMVLITNASAPEEFQNIFGYSSDGHYVLVTDVKTIGGKEVMIYNDPNYKLAGSSGYQRSVSVDEMYTFMKYYQFCAYSNA